MLHSRVSVRLGPGTSICSELKILFRVYVTFLEGFLGIKVSNAFLCVFGEGASTVNHFGVLVLHYLGLVEISVAGIQRLSLDEAQVVGADSSCDRHDEPHHVLLAWGSSRTAIVSEHISVCRYEEL